MCSTQWKKNKDATRKMMFYFYTCNPTPWEAEAGRLQVQCQPLCQNNNITTTPAPPTHAQKGE
jgi:hypothetical protein